MKVIYRMSELFQFIVLIDFSNFLKGNESEEVQVKILEFFSKMAASFFDSSKAMECLQKLHKMKDGYIFKSLQQLLDDHTSLTAVNSIQVS